MTKQLARKLSFNFKKNSGSNWVEFLKWRPDGKQLAAGVGNSVELVSLEGTIDSSYAFPDGTVADVAWHHKDLCWECLGMVEYLFTTCRILRKTHQPEEAGVYSQHKLEPRWQIYCSGLSR